MVKMTTCVSTVKTDDMVLVRSKDKVLVRSKQQGVSTVKMARC